jgi:hypothetical protein
MASGIVEKLIYNKYIFAVIIFLPVFFIASAIFGPAAIIFEIFDAGTTIVGLFVAIILSVSAFLSHFVANKLVNANRNRPKALTIILVVLLIVDILFINFVVNFLQKTP